MKISIVTNFRPNSMNSKLIMAQSKEIYGQYRISANKAIQFFYLGKSYLGIKTKKAVD